MKTRTKLGTFREISKREKELAYLIESNKNYFCDKYNNLYLLCLSLNNEEVMEIIFVRSNVVKIDETRKDGYYEPNYQVFEPLDELFHRIPERS